MRRGVQDVVPVGATDTVVLSANWNRKSIILSNSGPGNIYVSMGQPATVTKGIIVVPFNPGITITAAEFGALVGMEMHAVAGGSLWGPVQFVQSATVSAQGVSGAAVGPVLTYTVPAGNSAVWQSADWHLDGGTAPVINTLYTPSGGTARQYGGNLAADTPVNYGLPLNAGDKVQVNVATAGAGSTLDAFLGLLLYPPPAQVAATAQGTLTIWSSEE